MELISNAMDWTYKLIATWYGAATIGGFLILALEQCGRRREPSEDEVRQAAERYRQWYGDEAMTKIGDHMVGATFVSDGKHNRFLKRVAAHLSSEG